MNILFPPIDSVSFEEGPIRFDALVDGEPVNCVLTNHALGAAAAAIGQVISRREAFVLGQPAIKEVVARRITESRIVPVVITRAEIEA